jgi:hypothetical protein
VTGIGDDGDHRRATARRSVWRCRPRARQAHCADNDDRCTEDAEP